jgi:ferrous iron transport protein A
MRLSECKQGIRAKVTDLLLTESIRKRMMDLGLLPGTEVSIVRKAPFGGPLVVQFRGYQISFRLSEAQHIMIEAI